MFSYPGNLGFVRLDFIVSPGEIFTQQTLKKTQEVIVGFELILVRGLFEGILLLHSWMGLIRRLKQPCGMAVARWDMQLGRKATHKMGKNKNKLRAGKVSSDSRRN